MQIGIVGLGRMGFNMAERLLAGGHSCVVYNRSPEKVQRLSQKGAKGTASLKEFVQSLQPPRHAWIMLPAGDPTEEAIASLAELLAPGDAIIDGGNTHYTDDLRRAGSLAKKQIHYLDVGTSGGIWGVERGYCLMIGGDAEAVQRLDPVFAALTPGRGDLPRTPGREQLGGTAEQGYLHCGPAGAGHFVKMVHNGIEYGLMAAYAEGLNILHHANVGRRDHAADAETTPLRHPEHYQYDLNLADVTEVWRRGSVIASWLLDLTAAALAKSPDLESFAGRVADSGEGRWTIMAAVDESVPAPVLSSALYSRFDSRGESEFANKVLSAMRYAFGGHLEKGG